jgi:hypothetical protein
MLQNVRVHSDSESGFDSGIRQDSPRGERGPPPTPTDLKVIADALNPPTEAAFEDPATEVMNLIPGGITRPGINRILGTERMTQLEIPRQRNGLPQLLRWCRD